MFQRVADWFDSYRAKKIQIRFLRSPIGKSVSLNLSSTLYEEDNYLSKFVSSEDKIILINKILNDIFIIANADDPVMECRKYIHTCVNEFASLGAIIIYPAPKKDYFGYRGMPGITGEMYEYRHELIVKDETLKKYIFALGVENKIKNDPDYLYELFLRISNEATLCINAANIMRIYLKDYHPESEKDWLRKYIEVELALSEFHYRRLLGLNNVLAEQSPIKACVELVYMNFSNFILNGAPHPRYDWEELFEQCLSGNVKKKLDRM